MAGTAAIVLKLVLRVPVVLVILQIATVGATEGVTSAAFPRSATGMTATAAIVLKLVRRVCVALLLWVTVLAPSAASQRTATGITATAATFLRLVI